MVNIAVGSFRIRLRGLNLFVIFPSLLFYAIAIIVYWLLVGQSRQDSLMIFILEPLFHTTHRNFFTRSRLDFQRDVRILAALEDHNIARVLGMCSQEEPLCVIMEYLEHGDLCQFLRSHGPSEAATTLPIGVKTLR